MTKKNSFIILTPGFNVLKLFSSLILQQSKLECFPLEIHLSLAKHFTLMSGAYLREDYLEGDTIDFDCKFKTTRTNTLAYFSGSSVTKKIIIMTPCVNLKKIITDIAAK